MSSIGSIELVVILVIVILIYALGRSPEFGGAISRGKVEFRQVVDDAKPKSAAASGTNAGKETGTIGSSTQSSDKH